MTTTSPIRSTVFGLVAMLAAPALFAGMPANANRSTRIDPQQAMLTMPQAVTIAEVTQAGTAYGVKRESAGADIVYHVKVSTLARGVVDVHVNAFGGRVEVPPRDRD